MNDVVQWLTGQVPVVAYPALLLLSLAENMFPPLSSMVILPLGGFLVGRGELDFVAVIAVTTLGSTLGATLLYAVARRLGPESPEELADRGWLKFGSGQLERSGEWFRRYGATAVLLGRVVPVVRSLISIPAGMARMPRTTFVVYTTTGNLGWNAGLVTLGWALGDNWPEVRRYGHLVAYAVIVLLAVMLARFLLQRLGDRNGEDVR